MGKNAIGALRQTPLLVLLAGVALSVLAWLYVAHSTEEQARVYFDLHVQDAGEAIQQRLNLHNEVLRGAHALFSTTQTVSRRAWDASVADLRIAERLPGVQGIGFIRRLPAGEKTDFETRIRKSFDPDQTDQPDFAIFPAGARDDYYPVEYFATPQGEIQALGLDYGAFQASRDALERARDTGRLTVSARLPDQLAQTNEKSQPAFLILMPVYRGDMMFATLDERRKALVGFVFSRIGASAMLNHVLGRSLQQDFYPEIHDGGPVGQEVALPAADNLLYDPDPPGKGYHALSRTFGVRFETTKVMPVGGRNWVMHFASRPGFRGGEQDYVPWLVLAIGLLATFILFFIVLMLTTERERIAAEVRRQKSLITQVLDALPIHIFLKDGHGRFVLVNEEAARAVGVPRAELVGKSDFEIFPAEVAEKMRRFDDDARSTVGLVQRESRIVTKGGEERYVLAGKTMIAPVEGSEPLVLGYAVDITERKHAEDAMWRQKKFFHNIIDSVPNLIFVKDIAGRFVLVNKAAADFYGKPASAIVRHHNAEFHQNTEQVESYLRIDREVIETGRQILLDEPAYLPNGEVRWFATTKKPLVQPDGKVLALCILVDITERKASEQALRDSEARLRAILDNATPLIYLKDMEGRYQLVNRQYEKVMHLDAKQILGKTDFDLFSQAVADFFRGNDLKVVAAGEAQEFEESAVIDGVTRTVVSVKFPLRDSSGEIYAVCGISTDITERLQLEKEATRARANELSRAMIDALGEGVVGLDNDFSVTFVNPEAERILGFTEAELCGRFVFEAFQGCCDGYSPASVVATVIAQKRALRVDDVTFLRKDGGTVPVAFVVSPIVENDAVRGAALSFQDISRRKQAEAALTYHLVELARMNAELDEFTYVASHDLQEPVRKLIAFSDWLRRDLGTALPPRAAQDLEFIADAAQRMQRLVQDLLALSRTGKTAMTMDRVKLDDAVDRALEALSLRIRDTGATVTRDPLPTVSGDLTLLTQLYQNLIGNALKFTGDKPPEIHLSAERQADGKWVLGVRDNGIGIKPQYAEQIFQPFRRLHGRGKYEGSGIGLAICRKVVERHQGMIWVESGEGKGAHFKFVLHADSAAIPGKA